MEIERLGAEGQSNGIHSLIVFTQRQREGKESRDRRGNKCIPKSEKERGRGRGRGSEREKQNIERVRNFCNRWNRFYKITWFSKCIVSYYCLQENESNLFFTVYR